MPIVVSVQRKALEIRRSQLRQELGLDLPDVAGDVADRVMASDLREITFATNEQRRSTLRQIEAALQRIRDGVYGKCTACGDTISDRRLLAIAWVEFCIGCATELERQPEVERC